jgi:hypothetical protein
LLAAARAFIDAFSGRIARGLRALPAPAFALHQIASPKSLYTGCMPALLFRCPTTTMLVQHWTDEEKDSEDDYEGVTCPACAGTHFVNGQGKVLGSDEE